MDKVTGGKLAADALIAHGVKTIFTLSGGHITPIYKFLEGGPIQLFDTRHEQAAVFMAEAYGRMTRTPGTAMVTAGPGFTNALTGVANARQANSPLVLISGCVGVNCNEKLDLQDMRQAPIIEPMVKKALVCHTTSRIPEFIDMAYRIAGSGRPGPVYLELPVDVLNNEVNPGAIKLLNTPVKSQPSDGSRAAEVVELIKAAKQPIVFAGSGAWYSGSEKLLVDFAEKTGIPIFTASMGRGVIPDTHPLCFESSVGTRPGPSLFAQTETDLMIMLGNRFTLYYMFGDLIDTRAKIVQVDIEPDEIGRNVNVDVPIHSDVAGFLGCVNYLLDEQGVSEELKTKFEPWVAMLTMAGEGAKNAVQPLWDSEETPIHPMRLTKEIDNFLDRDDDIVVGDGGDTQIWMSMTRTVRKPGRYLDSGLYGCLGVGLPYANAAQFLNPDKRVCLIIGDGSVGFNFMEFETACRKKLPIVVVISNDQGWGMIRHSQELRLGHAIEDGTWIGRVDYHDMVKPLGAFTALVEKPEDIRPALEAAFASGKPACINVMTDTTTISPGSIALANVGAYQS
jgi:thiamine pyrophosphate-dependent acetolactate synthase large subunit-like protein